MTAYPLLLCLPGGIRAHVRIERVVKTNAKGKEVVSQLVSDPPVYALDDGTSVELDVTIPNDLAALGWYWFGSALRWDGGDTLRGISIHTSTFGIPGVFDQARRYELRLGDLAAQRVERLAAPTKQRRPTKQQPPNAPATVQQLAMEFV